jgi:glyceraldehyde 3-phosphate dehydrogenase
MIRIALNGFGRIGKNFFRTVMQDESLRSVLEIVAINVGPEDPSALPYMIRYDSILGTWDIACEYSPKGLQINKQLISVFAEKDPQNLPWRDLNIDWVVDVSGKFTHRDGAQKHLDAGAKKVLISAPAENEDVAIIPGVNDEAYNAQKHGIVSLGSCTTNALMPVLQILDEFFGIEHALVSTTHAYTNSQVLLDVNTEMKDPRKSRAAGLNIIPTSTGAQKMVSKVLPQLAGKVSAHAIRVPVANVSLLEVTTLLKKMPVLGGVLIAFEEAKLLKPTIIDVCHERLVSSDFMGNAHSVIIDATLCTIQGPLVKIVGWYDNEWGYACRLKEFLTQNG